MTGARQVPPCPSRGCDEIWGLGWGQMNAPGARSVPVRAPPGARSGAPPALRSERGKAERARGGKGGCCFGGLGQDRARRRGGHSPETPPTPRGAALRTWGPAAKDARGARSAVCAPPGSFPGLSRVVQASHRVLAAKKIKLKIPVPLAWPRGVQANGWGAPKGPPPARALRLSLGPRPASPGCLHCVRKGENFRITAENAICFQ